MKTTSFALILALAGCSSGGGYIPPRLDLASQDDGGARPDLAQTPPDFAGLSPDFSTVVDFAVAPNDLAFVQKNPVGSTCQQATMCSGPNAQCKTAIGQTNVPTGYCSNSPCANDNDCGNLGFCPGNGVTFCLGSCTGKGSCGNTNNRCFYWDVQNGVARDACLPSSFSACNPTQSTACNNTGACLRAGPDDVGDCLPTCSFGGACPANAQNQAQSCYQFNQRIDVNGNATGDWFAGLACTVTGTVAPGQPCTYLNDCTAGYECNTYNFNNAGKFCKKQCRSGFTDCNGFGGTCQNAFKLTNFNAGAVGLCL